MGKTPEKTLQESIDDLAASVAAAGGDTGVARPIGVPIGYQPPPFSSGQTMGEAWSDPNRRQWGGGAPRSQARADPYMDGDYYVDPATDTLYGPKVASTGPPEAMLGGTPTSNSTGTLRR